MPGCARCCRAIWPARASASPRPRPPPRRATKLRVINPDLMVLDVMMPGETGLALTEALRREQGRDVPVLLLTARGAPEDRIAGFEAGADDYLRQAVRAARTGAAHPRHAAPRAPPPAVAAPAGPGAARRSGVRSRARRAARRRRHDPADRRRGGAAGARSRASRTRCCRARRSPRPSAWTKPASGRSTCR